MKELENKIILLEKHLKTNNIIYSEEDYKEYILYLENKTILFKKMIKGIEKSEDTLYYYLGVKDEKNEIIGVYDFRDIEIYHSLLELVYVDTKINLPRYTKEYASLWLSGFQNDVYCKFTEEELLEQTIEETEKLKKEHQSSLLALQKINKAISQIKEEIEKRNKREEESDD